MLIKDLTFLQHIDNPGGIKGGKSTSATSEKPNAKAAAKSEGDISFIKTSATGEDGTVSTALLAKDNILLGADGGQITDMDLSELFADIEGLMNFSLM